MQRFSDTDVAFARAWEVHAPGLGGWSVVWDDADDEAGLLLVDPPLTAGDGFEVRLTSHGVEIRSVLGLHRAANLRDALLLICPLGREVLAQVDALAALPEPVF